MKLNDAPLHPTLPATTAQQADAGQQFRLQKIGELEAFLRSEVEYRGHLHKKYRRAVNALDGTCAALGTACVVAGAAGAGLLASCIGFVPGIVLEAITWVIASLLHCLLDVAGVAVSRRCCAKTAKHEAALILASAKLNTVHSHISKALEDCPISDDEYKLIPDEINKYHTMKEEIRRKHTPAAGGVIDEETKNELIRRQRDQARASFIKKLAVSDSP